MARVLWQLYSGISAGLLANGVLHAAAPHTTIGPTLLITLGASGLGQAFGYSAGRE